VLALGWGKLDIITVGVNLLVDMDYFSVLMASF
jgi:hypothetical protein